MKKRPAPAGAAPSRHASPPANAPGGHFSVLETLSGRSVFILGATGFVGKVALGLLLEKVPSVRRVYVMVRRGTGTDSAARFWNNIIPSPVFDPLRTKYGGAEGLAAFVREKIRVVDGDITEENLGLSDAEAQKVADDIDVVLNSSGRVTFNPPIESAIRTNVGGTKNVIAFVKRMRRPALVHTSTCFVAGNRSGEVWENETLDGYFPRWQEMPGTKFSVEQEIKDVDRIAAEVRAQAEDAQVLARLRRQARERLREQGRDPDDEGTLRLSIARERKDWVRNESTERGMARAAEWGWPNIYTYTKSMGDQLVAREEGICRAIVRPAIVESALSYPFPGWNEGFTTSAPLVYLALKGQHLLPVSERLILDMVPVDHIAAAMLMVTARCCVEQGPLVYQLSSGDLNPSRIERVVTVTGLYKRQQLQEKEAGNKFLNDLAARMEFRAVGDEEYRRWSLPMFNKIASKVSRTLDRLRPRWGAGRFTSMVDRLRKNVDEVARVTTEAQVNVDLFRPFIHDNEYIFRADNIRALRDRMPEGERPVIDWSPENLDWYDYFMNVHFPGLRKWVLPELDQTYAPRPKSVYAHRDLIELFDTTTKLNATRVAMRMERDGREEVYSYENLQELAARAGAFLIGENLATGDRVILFAKNGPEWAMAYFGILKAGGVATPVAHESTVEEVVNIARASGAVSVIVGDDLLVKRPGLAEALAAAKLATRVLPMTELFVIGPLAAEEERRKKFPRLQDADTVASLIFTSGTTGNPKGVMLTHRNLTFMVSELVRVFEFGPTDGMLSVLPLHHTFEFSAGLLVPLSKGAQITYLRELTGEVIAKAMRSGHITAIVGVPALWELLRRRVLQKFSDRAPLFGRAVEALAAANFEVRARSGINLGALMFLPIHEGFGGRIRYLISGGSALSPEVLKTFYGMGFDFFEGYGLTETSPVLTVSTPKKKPKPGSVGRALVGIDLKIAEPDAHGVGEVVARGRNVMAGYYNDEQATKQTIREGWFHTGDLGRFDDEGDLFLVGRSKDIIVDSNGKNVYPDEIEEIYAGCPLVKELSVVGLPDGTSERVACAVVLDVEKNGELPIEEQRAQVRAHFDKVAQKLPFWKRVKTLEFWEGELPRTAKRSVKRRDVTAVLRDRLAKSGRSESGAAQFSTDRGGAAWFLDLIARVSGKSRDEITLHARVDALGFDSLMFSELHGALDAEGMPVPADLDFTGAPDVAALLDMIQQSRASAGAGGGGRRKKSGRLLAGLGDDAGGDGPAAAPVEKGEIALPSVLARAGKRGLGLGQQLFYRRMLDTKVDGLAHVPHNVAFILASNHSSHLDMGVLKVALGETGRDLASLAAADYFFSNRWRRAYFKNFTNLVPMERSGSVRKSLDTAERVLRGGRSMVIFPEGTRSQTGKMREFLPSLGYLALRSGVGILPAHIAGAYEALPKGKAIPRARNLRVRFGPFLGIDFLQRLTRDLPTQEGWRLCSALTQRIVENLRDGKNSGLDADAIRAAWDGTVLGPYRAVSPRKVAPAAPATPVAAPPSGHKPHRKPKAAS